MKFIYLILAISAILSFSSITSLPMTMASYHEMNAFHDQMVYELEKVEEQWNIVNGQTLGITTASTTWWFKGSVVELSNIKISSGSLTAKNLNYTSVWQEGDQFSVKMEGQQAFALQISFDYKYSCFSSGTGQGEVFLQAFDTVFDKNYNTTTGEVNVDITAKFTDVSLVRITNGPYAGNEHVAELAKTAMGSLVKNSDENKLLNKIFEDELNKYYSLPSILDVQVSWPNTTVGMLYEDLRPPKILPDLGGVIFYYEGVWEPDTPNKTVAKTNQLAKSDSKIPKTAVWDAFDSKDGPFQVFIGNFIFWDFFNSISDDGIMNFTLSWFPPETGIDMNVDTMSQFYPSN